MSELAKLETGVVDIAKKIKAGVEDAGNDAVKLAAWLQNNSAEVTALAGLAGPQAASVTNVGLNLTNLAINAVKSAGSAAAGNGLSVSLDQATVDGVKALIAAIEKI
jgi:hypothetical protein